MSKSARALCLLAVFVFATGSVCAQSVKEFQTADGLVRVAPAPASDAGPAPTDSIGNPTPGFFLDSLTDLTVLPDLDGRIDPLFDLYFQDGTTGEEFRFPAKLSQLRDFLRQHRADYLEGNPASHSVTFVRDLSRGLRVRMMKADEGVSK